MSVAKCLGVDDRDGPNMKEARSQWPHWCEDEPALAIVEDLLDLPHWMRQAEPGERDAVVSALLRIGATDRRASMVFAWLLVPGASLLAGRLRNLVDVIDEVVAGQLWIQICEHDPSDDTYVAKKILSRVEREAKAELGVGDLAKRRGPTTASSSATPARGAPRPAWVGSGRTSRPPNRSGRSAARCRPAYVPRSCSAGSSREPV